MRYFNVDQSWWPENWSCYPRSLHGFGQKGEAEIQMHIHLNYPLKPPEIDRWFGRSKLSLFLSENNIPLHLQINN